MKPLVRVVIVSAFVFLANKTNALPPFPDYSPRIHLGQGQMAGEVTARSVILQSRLTSADVLIADDLPGARGTACFELSADSTFTDSWYTEWMDAVPVHDYIVKSVVCGLKPGTRYFYRVHFGSNRQQSLQPQ